VSKANTTAQILLAGFVLADLSLDLNLQLIQTGLIWLTALLTGLSATAYLVQWMRHMAGFAESDGKG
jgi:cardiolipin synthase (CMP-forming)